MVELYASGPDNIEGPVDDCVQGVVRGWVSRPGEPQRSLTVEAFADGRSVDEGVATLPRVDLRRAGKSAFAIAVDADMIQMPVAKATVHVKGGPQLPGGAVVNVTEMKEKLSVPASLKALHLRDDDTPLDDHAIEALHVEISAWARAAGAGDAWQRIRLSDLRARRRKVPDLWSSNGNFLLAASDQGSFVKSVLPPNSVRVGRPANPMRTGMIWTREDAP
jgi:hypothetical protein